MMNGFEKLPSTRKYVQTGQCSDPNDDEVASTSTTDTPILQ